MQLLSNWKNFWIKLIKMKKKIVINDKIQSWYVYYLTEEIGKNFREDFLPQLTPQEMLEAWVFWGKYMTDCEDEFPSERFKNAKISPEKNKLTK